MIHLAHQIIEYIILNPALKVKDYIETEIGQNTQQVPQLVRIKIYYIRSLTNTFTELLKNLDTKTLN